MVPISRRRMITMKLRHHPSLVLEEWKKELIPPRVYWKGRSLVQWFSVKNSMILSLDRL